MSRRLAVWVVLFNAIVCPCLIVADHIQDLGLVTVHAAQATLYLDPDFADQTQAIREQLDACLQALDDRREQWQQLSRDADRWITPINRALGLTPDDAFVAKQREVFSTIVDGTIEMTTLADPDELEVYLVDADKLKDYLRAGNTFPQTSYNAQTDKAFINTYRRSGSETGKTTSSDRFNELTIIVNKAIRPADTLGEYFDLFDLQPMMGLYLSETTRYTIIHAVTRRSGDPRTRWFSEGLAYPIVTQVLLDAKQDHAAQLLRESYSTAGHDNLRGQCNLRYWLDETYQPEVMLSAEGRLHTARIAFATELVNGLIARHGTGWVPETIHALQTSPAIDAATITRVVSQCTGEDIDQLLDGYQSFATPQEGLTACSTIFGQAIADGDLVPAAFAATRLLELQFNSVDHLPVKPYMTLIKILNDMGQVDKAVQQACQLRKLMGTDFDSAKQRTDAQKVLQFIVIGAFKQRDLSCVEPRVMPFVEQHQHEDPVLRVVLADHLWREGDAVEARRMLAEAVAALPQGLPDDIRAHANHLLEQYETQIAPPTMR